VGIFLGMPRTVQTLHYIQGQVVCESSVCPTSPTARDGRVEGLTRLIVLDLEWVAKCCRAPQTFEGVTSTYSFNPSGDEHLLTIRAQNGTYTYQLSPAQFKAADGGLMCFVGTATEATGDPLPSSPSFSFGKDASATSGEMVGVPRD
jgi:hypothetical protein